MKAYDLSMGLIFLNAGIYITASFGLFGDLSELASIFDSLNFLYTPMFTLPGVDYAVKGIDLIALALAGGTIVLLNSNAINDRGLSYIVFATIFWGSFVLTSLVFNKIDIPGFSVFYSVFLLAATLLFAITLIQMPTGGQKSFV